MCAKLAALETAPLRRFSREWFLSGLQTAGWVAIITLLIWVYADIYFTHNQSLTVTLRIHADSDENAVILAPERAVSLQLRVKGNRHTLEQLAGRRFSYDAAKELLPGRHEKDTVELLSALPAVRKGGVEIHSAVPKTVDVHLDTLVTIPGVPVKFDFAGGEPSDVKLEPDRIDLRIPASLEGRIDKAKLVLLTQPVDLRDRPAGERVTMDVHIRPPDIAGCRLARQFVRATFTVGREVLQKQFDVPISVQSPQRWFADGTWSQYQLLRRDPLEWKPKIAVKGGRIDLEKLRPEDIEAYIVLTEDDKKATEAWLPREVQVRFPKGLKLQAEPVSPVHFRLEKRPGAGP